MSAANDFTGLLEPAVDIARTAGEKILEIYNSDFAVEEKDDRSPLTAADMASHHAIIDGLKALKPDIPVLSEESKSLPFKERSGWQTYWLVDPLDGTKEFVKRNGEFTVNIAFIEGDRPVLGVVYVPVTGMMYFGSDGVGAFKRENGQDSPIRVSAFGGGTPRVVASRSHRDERTDEFLAAYPVERLISAGSSLKLCRVAEGTADMYPRLGRTMEWDIAAGHAVLCAAGGSVSTLDGQTLRYGKPGFDNPHFVARGWKGAA